MPTDPMEEHLDIYIKAQQQNEDIAHIALVNTIEATDAWSAWKKNLATETWNE